MAGGITIKVTGMDKTLAKLDAMKGLEQDLSDELAAFGMDVARDAKQVCPVDEGYLKNSIFFDASWLKVEIGARANYAAYVEFGTRKFAAAEVATLPPDIQAYAAQFKGRPNLLATGMRARPFLFPSYETNRLKLIKRLKELFNA